MIFIHTLECGELFSQFLIYLSQVSFCKTEQIYIDILISAFLHEKLEFCIQCSRPFFSHGQYILEMSPSQLIEFTLIFFNSLKNYFWLCWVSIAVCGLSLVAARGVLLQLQGTVSFSPCSTWAQQFLLSGQLLCRMWNLPKSDIEPVSPASAVDS